MFERKRTFYLLATTLIACAMIMGCDDDSNYDERTVVFVSSMNDGHPYFSDVLNQNELFIDVGGVPVLYPDDDYVEEDWVKVQIHNRPYNGYINPAFSLGDILVTGYRCEYETAGGTPLPVETFVGKMSSLVPANSYVEVYVLLVPFVAKNNPVLDVLKYSGNEVLALAHYTFYGHEVMTERELEFTASITVNFADPLEEEEE